VQEVPERHTTNGLSSFDEFSRRYQVLLQTADPVARQALPELLVELSKLLHEVVDFNLLSYGLHDPAARKIFAYTLDESILLPDPPLEISMEGSPLGWVWMNQSSLVIGDLSRETRFPGALQMFHSKGLRSVAMLPMTSTSQRLGVLVFGSFKPSDYENGAVHFLEQIAGLVGLAISNLLTRQAAASEEEQLRALTAVSLQLSERSIRAHHALQQERARLETVLEINAALAASKLDMKQMFPAISKSLARTISHDTAVVNLWNEQQRSYLVFAKDSSNGSDFAPSGLVLPSDYAFTTQILDEYPEGTVVLRAELEAAALQFEVVRNALNSGIVCWCTVPMRTPNRLIGVLYLGSRLESAFTEKDLELLRQVANGLALFVENALIHEALQGEKEDLQKLLKISRTFTPSLDTKKLLIEIANCTRLVFKEDYAYLALYDKAANVMRLSPLDSSDANAFIAKETSVPLAACPSAIAMRREQTVCFGITKLGQIGSDFVARMLAAGVRTLCCFPLISRNNPIGALCIARKKDNAFAPEAIELMTQVVPQVAVALDNSRAYSEIASLKDRLVKEKIYLEQEIRDALDFEEIVGMSSALTHVLDQVKTVAPSDATVLILGETGTGKELIARAVHRLSSRASGNFVKVNCAAIPTGLLESELFGHEKGAFTGAISQKVGRMELADKGTLLLDEVGEIPLELQPKLLRALQDHEFERLGGTRTIKVNVRILAATNRDLSEAVAKREFRSDLYYRLHVFPLHLPPLRERREDIPLLVRYFVSKFARRMNKQIESIPEEAMEALERWHWPGNIRELENFLERSVILTEGTTLRVPVGELCGLNGTGMDSSNGRAGNRAFPSTLEELERQYILQVLQQAGWVISGSDGAAAMLGMKRTTLQSKMLRLGITREEFGC
jgi:formate hydrogenlyase transcriptional activator